MGYDDQTHFSETNIESYLAECEEYLSQLIGYVAQQQGDPNPAISSVPFNMLPKKDHFQTTM